ncbi:hypothetical protein GCM10010517_13060 [Streptosporangium fragile]|uniref:Leucine-rich repeat domain-containing protein n=1 Tax=Streptosporangium fragile TaxID=46186 RepID=A0ABN3VSJ5_9ACTN
MTGSETGWATAVARIAGCLRDGTTTLDLSGFGLKALPESLGDLTHLTELNLRGNRLTALPESLGSLTASKILTCGTVSSPSCRSRWATSRA